MKTFIFTLFTATLFLHTSFAQKVDTLEAHQLWEEGSRLWNKSRYYSAAKKIEKAGKIFKKEGFDIRYADCLSLEGLIHYFVKSSSNKAASLYNKALQIYQANLNPKHIKIGLTYKRFGSYYMGIKSYYSKAKVFLRKAISLLKGKRDLSVAWTWNGLGIIYLNEKNYEQAIQCFKKCEELLRKILKPNDERFGTPYGNMGQVYLEQKKYDSSLQYLKKSLLLQKEIEGSYANIGDLYYQQKNYGEALKYYKQALKVAKKRYNSQHPNIGGIYRDIGNTYLQNKMYKSALEHYQKGLFYLIDNFQDSSNIYHQTKFNASNYHYQYTLLLSSKAHAFAKLSGKLSDLQASLYNYQNCDSLLNHLLKYYRYGQVYISTQYFSKVYPRIINVCQQLQAKTKNSYYQQLAFYFAEKSHSNFLAGSLHARKAKLQANLPDSITDQELYLQQQLSYFQRKVITEKEAIQKQVYQDSLFVYTRKREVLNEMLAQEFPKYYQLRFQNTPVTVTQIQQKLNEQTVLLNYDFGEEQSRVFVVSKDTFQIVPLAKQSQITKVLNGYYEAIQNEVQPQNFAVKSYAVYQTLFQPIKAFLRGKQKLVIANPTLLSLPLGAVIDRKVANARGSFSQFSYLIKQYAISYHYSASLWWQGQEGKSATKANQRFMGMAPFSGGKSKAVTTRGDQGLLPESKKEINAIFNFFKQKNLYAEAYLSKAATKQQFLNRLKDFDILHIASHSTANL
ncbi:MAG TPA: hypothetical protein DCS93_26060, partial [Microscillaceae bacterium]|nr:hypothetical protein [Microscillaceae bacterium]